LLDLIDDDSVVAFELSALTSSTRREICGVFKGFLSLFKKYEEDKNT